MRSVKSFLCVFFVFLCGSSAAQNYELSKALDLPETGWAKLLQLKNGNTFLLHLEQARPLSIKIFDKDHKEIVSRKLSCKLLNVHNLKYAWFSGLFDINGECVLFMQQSLDPNTMIRFRIDATNGSVIEEKAVVISHNFTDVTRSYILKRRDANDYFIFFRSEILRHPSDTLELVHYNEKHEVITKTPLNITRQGFQIIEDCEVSMDKSGGICVTMVLATQKNYAVAHVKTSYDRSLAIGYLRPNGDHFVSAIVKLPDSAYVQNVLYTYNPLTENLNIALIDTKAAYYSFGLQNGLWKELKPLFILVNGKSFTPNPPISLTNNSLNSILSKQSGAEMFRSVPERMFTDENGITTIISEDYNQYNERETGHNYLYTHFGNLGLTRYDEKGQELDGVLISKDQTVNLNVAPRQISLRGSLKNLFAPGIEQWFQEQFISVNAYTTGKNIYVILNDFEQHKRDSTLATGLPIFDFRQTNGVYYKLDGQNKPVNYYLFEPPKPNESKASFLEGADFDDTKNTYATLVLCRVGDNYTLKVAWCHLE